jgi:hypothetical protein
MGDAALSEVILVGLSCLAERARTAHQGQTIYLIDN